MLRYAHVFAYQIANTALANGAKGADADGYRAEFVQLVKLAAGLVPATPEPAPAQ